MAMDAAAERTPLLSGEAADQYAAVPATSSIEPASISAADPGSVAQQAPSPSRRLVSIDLFRGILMPLMALDHAAFVLGTWSHPDEGWDRPLDQWPTTSLFLIRLVSDPCAPGFTITLGVSVVLFAGSRLKLGWSWWKIWLHLFMRGIVIVLANQFTVLEAILSNHSGKGIYFMSLPLFHLGFNLPVVASILMLSQVLESCLARIALPVGTGIGKDRMKVLAAGIVDGLLLCIAAGLCVMTYLLVPPEGSIASDRSAWFWILVMPQFTPFRHMLSVYPPIPWLSLGIFGLVLGRWLARFPRKKSVLVAASGSMGVLLIIIWLTTRLVPWGTLTPRLIPNPHHRQIESRVRNHVLDNWKSFFYASKYPPDVSYVSLWAGVTLFMFAACEALKDEWAEQIPLVEFGRAPLFFFMIHVYVLQASVPVLRYFRQADDIRLPQDDWRFWFELAMCLVVLWYLTRRYARWKMTQPSNSIWRFF